MQLHQLRYFIAAAECTSVSRAAERCGIAQPSLSQQLKRLEESLGAVLFDRLGRGIALTDAGRALLPRARRIVAEVEDAGANLLSDTAAGGPITAGAIPTMAPYLLPAALAELRREMPAAEATISEATTEDLVEALLDSKLDCAILSTPLDHDQLDVEVIGVDELLVVVPAGHPLGGQVETGWSALRGESTVTLREIHCLGRQIEAFCRTRRTSLRVACRSTQLTTVFELVALGMGISIVPEMAATHHGSRRWSYVRLAQHKPVREVAVAWRRGRTRPLAAERLAAIVAAQCADGRHRLPSQPARATRRR